VIYVTSIVLGVLIVP